MDLALFEKRCWPGTIVIVITTTMFLFVVAGLLGYFIDPSMPIGIRRGIVFGWSFITAMTTIFIVTGRHA